MPKTPSDRASRAGARREAQPLTRGAIVDAALALIDAQGLEGLTMRRLGAALGVEAMSVYHHFAGKGALLDAVQERLLDEVELPPRGALPPLERLRAIVTSWRAVAVRHPPAFILLAGRRFNTERAFAVYEAILEAHADAGLEGEAAARWFRLLGCYASGAGLADVASRERNAHATELTLERAPEAIPDAYPRVRAIAPHLVVERLDDLFDAGLDVLFAALAREVAGAAQRAEASTG